MTWGDIYKQFTHDYPDMHAEDYRPFIPFIPDYLLTNRAGIIVWLKNGDVIIYLPKTQNVPDTNIGKMQEEG